MTKIKLSELIDLFKQWGYVDYELILHPPCFVKDTGFKDIIIYYPTNLWGVEHKEYNELNLVLDWDNNIYAMEFESTGDRQDNSEKWKIIYKLLLGDLKLEIDVEERMID